jgi:hypothetical protein
MNPKYRRTVTKAMVRRKGTTAIAKKEQKKKHFQNPSAIQDIKFKALFDKKKSWIENMNSVDLKEMYCDSLPETIPDKASWTIPKLNEEEVTCLTKLIGKHGDSSFRKMSFDRKLNVFQWTEEQCAKKVKMLLVDKLVHVCEDGKCLCGYTPNSSYVPKEGRIRK